MIVKVALKAEIKSIQVKNAMTLLPCGRPRRLAMRRLAWTGRRGPAAYCTFLSGIVISICLLTVWVWRPRHSEYSHHETLTMESFEVMRLSLPKASVDSGSCVSPNLPVFTDFIRENRPKVIPAELCDRNEQQNWLHVSESRIVLKPQFAGANCCAEPIVRVDDESSKFGSAQPIHNGSELPSLGFRATCSTQDGRAHKSVYYGVRRMELTARQQVAGQQDNIIILGLDSLSRLESVRSLPQVSELMRQRLGGVTLKQYNILGDGTPAALLPILTGVREADMPEARKGFKGARHLDESMRWIFQDLRDRGFITLYGEEENNYGTFQTRFTGFKNEPVDFYLRPAMQKIEEIQTNDICIGNEMSSARMLSAVRDLFKLYPSHPKFAFLFFSSLSHENKDLTPMDSVLSKFVSWFLSENLTRNTSIILMSDHGQRHGPMRNSMQGKLEESLPLMTIALSRQLVAHRRAALQMLTNNSHRLTTPVDIHRTLLSLAGVRDATGDEDRARSFSLIDQSVPEGRTCSDAGIPTHWCSCLRLTRLSSPDSHQLSVRAARYAVMQMNLATRPFRHLCEELRLGTLSDVEISLASRELAKRERYVDWSYMAYNVENESVMATGYLTIRFSTEPNSGMFEATVQFLLDRASNSRSLNMQLIGEPSRINRYGHQADCVTTTAPHIRKFCYCRGSSS